MAKSKEDCLKEYLNAKNFFTSEEYLAAKDSLKKLANYEKERNDYEERIDYFTKKLAQEPTMIEKDAEEQFSFGQTRLKEIRLEREAEQDKAKQGKAVSLKKIYALNHEAGLITDSAPYWIKQTKRINDIFYKARKKELENSLKEIISKIDSITTETTITDALIKKTKQAEDAIKTYEDILSSTTLTGSYLTKDDVTTSSDFYIRDPFTYSLSSSSSSSSSSFSSFTETTVSSISSLSSSISSSLSSSISDLSLVEVIGSTQTQPSSD